MMPHKKNKRKVIQAAKQAAERAARPKPRYIGTIGHVPYAASGAALAVAIASAFPGMIVADATRKKPQEAAE